jgi:hypothetical protein
MKSGDLVFYDRFGTSWPSISPSVYSDDFGIGVVIHIDYGVPNDEDSACAEVIKDDGTKGFFSVSYLVPVD